MNTNDPAELSVALVASAPAIRSGLQSILQAETGICVRQSAASPADLAIPPGEVQLLVVAGWGSRLLDSLQRLPRPYLDLPVLLLSDGPLPGDLFRRFSGHPWGILPLDSSGAELSAALRALNEGLWVASPESIPGVMENQPVWTETSEAALPVDRLTERETEVLQLMAAGLSNKQIAARLHISGHTVKYHISSIYSKLSVSNRTEAARLGIRLGLVTL